MKDYFNLNEIKMDFKILRAISMKIIWERWKVECQFVLFSGGMGFQSTEVFQMVIFFKGKGGG